MKFWPFRGTIGSPVLLSCEQSLFRAFHSAGSISRFSHSFLLSALIPLKIPGWLPSSGCAEVCPSRSHHLSIPCLPFFPIWAESHSAKLKVVWCHFLFHISLFWFLETLLAYVMRGRWVFWRLCFFALFLIFFSRHFLSNCLNLLWLCAWKDPRPLMIAEDPSYLSLLQWVSFPSWCFFVWALSLLGLFILSWSPCTCFFGLS